MPTEERHRSISDLSQFGGAYSLSKETDREIILINRGGVQTPPRGPEKEMTSELALRDGQSWRWCCSEKRGCKRAPGEGPLGSLEESGLARKPEGPAWLQEGALPGKAWQDEGPEEQAPARWKSTSHAILRNLNAPLATGSSGKAFKEGAIELGLTF